MSQPEKVVNLPNLLLIGSSGSNSGKTVLACSLIERFKSRYPIEAIKITTIKDREGLCPKGGEGSATRGCGVCFSMEGKYAISEELDPAGNKDTCRLLAVGACRVFWLRAFSDHLTEGFARLREQLSPDAVYICESNSLRKIVEPGLFLLVKPRDGDDIKESAREVQMYVDRTIETNAGRAITDISGLEINGGRWVLREPASAIILAGGKSLRMGTDKALLEINGRPMIEHIIEQLRPLVSEIIISVPQAVTYSIPGVSVVADAVPDQGPFYGLVQAMKTARYPVCLVTACDIPEIPLRLVRRMIRLAATADAVVPEYRDYPEPLFAVYSKKLLPLMERSLGSGNRKLQDIYPECLVFYVPLTEPLVNLNDEAGYRSFTRRNVR